MAETMSFLAIHTIGIYGLLGSLQRRLPPRSPVAMRLSGLYGLDGVLSAVLQPSWITPLGTSGRLPVTLADLASITRAVCLAVGSRMHHQTIVRYGWRAMVTIDC